MRQVTQCRTTGKGRKEERKFLQGKLSFPNYAFFLVNEPTGSGATFYFVLIYVLLSTSRNILSHFCPMEHVEVILLHMMFLIV
jgi:hypothetical protein